MGVRSCGGLGPPRVTEERKPEVCNCSMRARCSLEEGTEVMPRRALEAFWRWEQTFARLTRDMVEGMCVDVVCSVDLYTPPRGQRIIARRW